MVSFICMLYMKSHFPGVFHKIICFENCMNSLWSEFEIYVSVSLVLGATLCYCNKIGV